MSTDAQAPAVTGFGFQRQMAEADFTAFRRWYDARCLLLATRADREAAFSRPRPITRAEMPEQRPMAA